MMSTFVSLCSPYTHLTPTLSSPELPTLFITQIEITSNDTLVEFRSADVPHAGQGLCVCVVFYKTEPTRSSARGGNDTRDGCGKSGSMHGPRIAIEPHDNPSNTTPVLWVRAF